AEPWGRADAPESERRSGCTAEGTFDRGIERRSGARSRRTRQRSPDASFRRRLLELLFCPNAVRIQLQRTGESLARLRVLIRFAETQTEPQPGFRVIGIEFQGLAEIGNRES